MDFDKTKNWEMRSAEFDFIEPDKVSNEFKKHRVAITSKDVELVKQQIQTAYSGIKGKQFSQGCGEEDCIWCNFVDNYYQRKSTKLVVGSKESESDFE